MSVSTGTTPHAPSVSPTAGEAVDVDRTRGSSVWVAIAILGAAALLVAPALVGAYQGWSAAPPLRVGVLEPAPTPNALVVPPPVETANAASPDVDAAGTHQFIQIEETLVVGIVEVGTPTP